MRFYTPQECEEWLAQRTRVRPGQDKSLPVERFEYPSEAYRFVPMTNALAHSIIYRQPVLLWVTEWGIWPSSENWLLYYRLRQTYGDFRLLDEAPGHLFLEHEAEDLSTFLQLAMLNGWDGYVLTQANYVNAFFSHDEFMDFYTADPGSLSELRSYFANSPGR